MWICYGFAYGSLLTYCIGTGTDIDRGAVHHIDTDADSDTNANPDTDTDADAVAICYGAI